MRSNELIVALAPFAIATNRHALSINYKVIEVQPQLIRSCSAYGILEASIALGANAPFVIDATSFIAVIKSLPADEEVELTVKGDTLHWSCGLASGKLALVKAEVQIPPMPERQTETWDATDSFIDCLTLGGLSCGDAALASAGVYGIVLDNRGDFTIYSTDDITISSCSLGIHIDAFADQVVISPDAARLLNCILNSSDKVQVAVAQDSIYCYAGATRCLIRPIPALKQDIAALRDNFLSKDVVATVPHARVAAFVKRATALAESARYTYVDISATSGALSLSFSEDKAASEEYYLAENLEVPDLSPIRVNAARLARALAYTTSLVLDHIERSVIVLIAADPTFSYMISGRKEAK